MEGDEPVEIELTPTRPGRGERNRPPWRSSSADPSDRTDATEGADPPHRWGEEISRRTVVTIAAVGFVALVIGWMLGRATGGSGGDSGPADETVPVTAESTESTESTVRTEEVAPVATTERPRPTTTTVPPVESTLIEVDSRLAGAAYDLVGTGRSGELVDLDPTSGELVTRRDIGVSANGGPAAIWAGETWVVVPDWETGATILIDDGEDPVRVPIGPPWQIFAAETAGEFWTLDDDLQSGAPGFAQRVGRYGELVGDPVELRVIPMFSDPAGGLVVQASGSTFRVDESGVTPIVDGTVLALDAERAVALVCDDQLECQYVVVDRATGQSTPLPIDPDLAALGPYWTSLDATRIAPDGHTIATTASDRNMGTVLHLIDLETGEFTPLTESGEFVVRWSPDGRFAFFLEAGRLMAHEIATGESFVVADDLPRLNALAIQADGES